jgi:hypothetical protein
VLCWKWGPSRSIRDYHIWRSCDCSERYLCCFDVDWGYVLWRKFCKQSPVQISVDLRFNICHTLSAPCHDDVTESVHKATRIIRLRCEERCTIRTPHHLFPLDKTRPRPTASLHVVTKRKIPSSAGIEPTPSKSLPFILLSKLLGHRRDVHKP